MGNAAAVGRFATGVVVVVVVVVILTVSTIISVPPLMQ